MIKNYFYKIYDLIVKSEFKIDELISIDETENFDVKIKYGKVPEKLIKDINEYKWYSIEKDYSVLKIKDVGNYYIKEGKEIIVEPYESAEYHYIKTYILGSAFGLLLKQRNQIAIHGGTVKIGDKAVILTGNTGAGKSTLTNAFRHNGYKFLCDDVSPLSVKDNIKVMPAYPQQKLCKDAMDSMGYNTENFKRIDEGRDKYAIPVHESFIKEPLNLGGICELEIHDGNDVEIEEVKGKDKIISVIRNIYRIELFRETHLDKEYFKSCLNIAMKIPIYKVKRPRIGFTVNNQIELIEKVLTNN